ncbi:hypothetical protein AHAS_Ahas15G0171800 [Arachis hypogaea]
MCALDLGALNASKENFLSMRMLDHCKLDSNTIVEAIKSLVEADPSLKVQYVTADDQAKFYTMSYPKA